MPHERHLERAGGAACEGQRGFKQQTGFPRLFQTRAVGFLGTPCSRIAHCLRPEVEQEQSRGQTRGSGRLVLLNSNQAASPGANNLQENHSSQARTNTPLTLSRV